MSFLTRASFPGEGKDGFSFHQLPIFLHYGDRMSQELSNEGMNKSLNHPSNVMNSPRYRRLGDIWCSFTLSLGRYVFASDYFSA